MNDFILQIIQQGGYFGVFVLMALENIFPPMPSEIIMSFGGVLVARGKMSLRPRACGDIGFTFVWICDSHFGWNALY